MLKTYLMILGMALFVTLMILSMGFTMIAVIASYNIANIDILDEVIVEIMQG